MLKFTFKINPSSLIYKNARSFDFLYASVVILFSSVPTIYMFDILSPIYKKLSIKRVSFLVGMTRLERATSRSRTVRSTKLSYIPTVNIIVSLLTRTRKTDFGGEKVTEYYILV